MSNLYVGVMSGTSMDAIDAALVEFSQEKPKLLATHSKPLSSQLKKELLSLCVSGEDEISRLGSLDVRLGKMIGQTCNALLKQCRIPSTKVAAIGSHGQTIRHYPERKHAFTLQIGDPNRIAEVTGITTVADFRRRDMAKGGQGAPLVPAFHAIAFRSAQEDRVVVNLGGIANITVLPKDTRKHPLGYDTGPASTLMDAWCQYHLDQPHDHHGQWARKGKIQKKLLEALLNDPYFKQKPPKSTGREHFNLTWFNRHLTSLKKEISAQDIQTTITELSAQSIANAIKQHAGKKSSVLICGGGIQNKYLIHRLETLLTPRPLFSTAKFGIPPLWVEAITWAWLAKQTLEGKPSNLPHATGAKGYAILGGIYPSFM